MAEIFFNHIKTLEKKKCDEQKKNSCYGKIIDAWAQPPSLFHQDNLLEAKHLSIKSGTYDFWQQVLPNLNTKTSRKVISPKDLVSLMNASGIDRICLSAWARYL